MIIIMLMIKIVYTTLLLMIIIIMKLFVWVATCPDTFASSYSSHANLAAGEVAALAEERKVAKYNVLPVTHSFTPVAIEMLGAIGPTSLVFLKELGWRARRQSADEHAASFHLQRLYVAVKRGNVASILGGAQGGLRG